MRSARTSLVLLALAAGLLGYILLIERGGVSSGELEQRKGNALPQFVRATVAKLEVQRKGKLTVLVRNPDESDEGGLWRVEAPYRAKADQEPVNALLGALETLDTRRRIERVTAADRKRFGLDAPRYRVWFTRGKLRVPLAVGAESPRGDGVYVQSSDPAVAFVAAKDLIDDLERDPTDYHAKELHEGVLVSTAFAVSWRDAHGARSVRKRDDGLWSFDPATSGLASAPGIEDAINAFDGLRAKHFVADKVADFSQYGLAAPRLELDVGNKKLLGAAGKGAPAAKPERREARTRLLVGAPCVGHAGESYVRVDGGDGVHCALDGDIAKLEKSFADLREARLVPLEDEAIEGVEVTHGAQHIELKKSGGLWSYAASRAGQKLLEGAARPESVSAWLEALRDARASRFDAGELGIVPPAELITLRVSRGATKPSWETRLRPAVAELLAQRGDEAQAVAFESTVAELLEPETARFRDLRVVALDEHALRAIEVRRGREIEHVVKNPSEPGFSLEAPLHAPADPIAMAELTRALSSVTAVRFAADEAQPANGLAAPEIVVTVERAAQASGKPSAPTVLRVGAPAPGGGRYAELQGERGVFVLADTLVRAMSERLVSRTLLATPLERIATLQLETRAHKLGVERDGAGWKASNGPVNLAPSAASALAQAVATLRAVGVAGYGPPLREQGFGVPFARLTVTELSSATPTPRLHVILIGGEAGEGARYGRRDTEPVTFVLSKASVAELTSLAGR